MDNNYINVNSSENNKSNNVGNENNQAFNSNNFQNEKNKKNGNKINNSFKPSNKNFKDNSKPGFGKSVLVPFISGILGATLVVGTCFNVPAIKKSLIGKSTSTTQSTQSVNYNNINTNLVSLSSFSDTGVAVAQKVLPSVVGIKVQYAVNSIFSRNTSTAMAEGSGVIISSDGYILTNNHVINSSEILFIRLEKLRR